MQSTVTSTQFTINVSDIWKGLIVAVITPIATIIISSLNAGTLTFDWPAIWKTAVAAALAYLLKNFLTPSAIVVKDAPQKQVEAVKSGDAEVKVMPT